MANTDTTAALTSSTNFKAKSGEGMLLLDEGTSNEEIAYATAESGGTMTVPLANRGLEGSATATHAAGANVKGPVTVGMWNDLIDSLINVLVQSTGALDTTKVADLATAQSLTNKTITDSTNNVMAKSLKSATTTVDVSAATAPSTGQVLTATDSTHATWQTATSSVLLQSVAAIKTGNSQNTNAAGGTWADIPSCSQSITISANSKIIAWTQVSLSTASTGKRAGVRLVIGSTTYDAYYTAPGKADTAGNAGNTTLIGESGSLSAGSYTVKVQWDNPDSDTIYTNNQYLLLQEVTA